MFDREEITNPEQDPLSFKVLTNARNQKGGGDSVTALDESAVSETMGGLV